MLPPAGVGITESSMHDVDVFVVALICVTIGVFIGWLLFQVF
jgi:hypothetical protein